MTQHPQWTTVDEGWGRRATDFATFSEPGNVREYVALHQLLDVRADDQLLDIACGSGLAVELATARGAACSGIDASRRLVAVARDRVPAADLRVGDMHDLPWPDASFDVVTSFRGIWGTTPDVFAEIRRVLRPGGRVGVTVWGHIKASPGAWALTPFTLAAAEKVGNQSAMVRLGRPGAGEELLAHHGFVDIVRRDIPFAWEFADPEHYARALASTGPAYEAIQAVGEEQFLAYARDLAASRVRAGLPLRAEIAVVGYCAVRPPAADDDPERDEASSYLCATPPSAGAQRLREDDVSNLGFVMNASRLWGRMAGTHDRLFDLMGEAARAGGLSLRHRGILVVATASTLGDSYCSLAWGGKLAAAAEPDVAAAVLAGDDAGLDLAERALASWARRITRAPNDTTPADLAPLRDAGFDDQQIFAITVFVSLRLAYSMVNDALGAHPDAALAASVPAAVRDAVTWGRPVEP